MTPLRAVHTTVASIAALGLTALATAALGASPPAKVVGNPAAGKPLFLANCSTCHILKGIGSKSTIGPNLDKLILPEATIIAEITKGGSSLMGKAGAKYMTQMMAYKALLTTTQIQDIAAYEYTVTHK
jgi:mono/diheme cytochrome c family protein